MQNWRVTRTKTSACIVSRHSSIVFVISFNSVSNFYSIFDVFKIFMIVELSASYKVRSMIFFLFLVALKQITQYADTGNCTISRQCMVLQIRPKFHWTVLAVNIYNTSYPVPIYIPDLVRAISLFSPTLNIILP